MQYQIKDSNSLKCEGVFNGEFGDRWQLDKTLSVLAQYHNAPLTPQNFGYSLFAISLGTGTCPKSNLHYAYANGFFCGGGGKGGRGVLWDLCE